MKARVLRNADVLAVVDLLRGQGYEVLAPFCGRGRDTCFDTVTDDNQEHIQIHLPNPYYPPKRFAKAGRSPTPPYSVLRLFAGLATAARTAWKLMVASAIPAASNPARINTHHSIPIR